MKNWIFVILVFTLFSACSPRIEIDPAILEKLGKIPPAPATLTDEQREKIPILMLTARGAIINPPRSYSSPPPAIPFDRVLKALADLPQEAWPAGRVILILEGGFGGTSEVNPSRSDADKVENELKAAGIRLEVGLSA